MRTIKCRGKCTDDSKYAGEWVEGALVQCEKSDVCLIVCAYKDSNCTFTYHVVPETVGEFSGFCDSEKEEIYEGDIMEVTVFDCFDNDEQYIVRIDWIGTEFMGVNVKDKDTAWNLCWLLQQDCEAKIIGNIHDNPELIKEHLNK